MLNLSEAAVSMALRNKPGVSTKTRRLVQEAAEKNGYDFSRVAKTHTRASHITFVVYKRQGAVVGETPFFSELSEGIVTACEEADYKLNIAYIHKGDNGVQHKIDEIVYSGCAGIVLLGTEMQAEDILLFAGLPIPLVLLDAYFDFLERDCVLINNTQGALMATEHLINRTKVQPGYLRSSYSIGNFEERGDGFYKAVRRHGMSVSKTVVHKLTPSTEGAFADMLEILENGEELAACYFADNDWIAIGAMKAFQKKGYRVPEDVAVIGFDDIPMASYIEPGLSTVHVPKKYMGEVAVKRLTEVIDGGASFPVKIEIATQLKKRQSIKL